MKQKILALAILVFILELFPREASSQKIMKLSDDLKSNSDPLSIKIRGGSLLKFDFGVYKTISAKGGVTRTKSSSKLFSSIEKSESKQKSSIVMENSASDTATINISVNETSEAVRENIIAISKGRVALEREDDPSKFKIASNIVAVITTIGDTTTWNFAYVTLVNTDNAKENRSGGMISDGNRKIEIKNITIWDNGKSPTLYSVVGYEFYVDGVAVAAMQHPPDTFQKKFVWMKNGLDEKMKLVVASAMAVLFSLTNTPS
jgi:hypothetical protein